MTDDHAPMPRAAKIGELPPKNGSQEIIAHMNTAIDRAHDVAIKDIEAMETRLDNLKKSLEVKKIATRESINNTITSIGTALEILQELDIKIRQIEEKHL